MGHVVAFKAHLYRDVGSRDMGHMAAPEPTLTGTRGPERRNTQQLVVPGLQGTDS
jgi:hypothetical protein